MYARAYVALASDKEGREEFSRASSSPRSKRLSFSTRFERTKINENSTSDRKVGRTFPRISFRNERDYPSPRQ